jgi:hypothetical protein
MANGHVARGKLNKIISQIASGATNDKVLTKRRRNRQTEYFVLAKQDGRLKPGIYGRDTGRGRITSIIVFVAKPTYRGKFNFYQLAEQSARKRFRAEFDAAIADAIRAVK